MINVVDGVVVDASIIKQFHQELIDMSGATYTTIIWVANNRGLIISDKILQQWRSVAGSQMFEHWMTNEQLAGRLKPIESPSLDPGLERKITIDFGFPRDDLEYIRCANVTVTKYIICVDMHFYEPSAKREDQKYKTYVRDGRNGSLCVFLRRKLSIIVGTIEHCCADFCIAI
jgi:hypothetical protein